MEGLWALRACVVRRCLRHLHAQFLPIALNMPTLVTVTGPQSTRSPCTLQVNLQLDARQPPPVRLYESFTLCKLCHHCKVVNCCQHACFKGIASPNVPKLCVIYAWCTALQGLELIPECSWILFCCMHAFSRNRHCGRFRHSTRPHDRLVHEGGAYTYHLTNYSLPDSVRYIHMCTVLIASPDFYTLAM